MSRKLMIFNKIRKSRVFFNFCLNIYAEIHSRLKIFRVHGSLKIVSEKIEMVLYF